MKTPTPHTLIDDIELKQCSKCQQYKILNNFAYAKNTWDNLYSSCKDCKKLVNTYIPKKIPDKLINNIMCRLCSTCNVWKVITLFVPNERLCIDCKSNYNINYYNKNKEKLSKANSLYYIDHKDEIYSNHKVWIDNNREYSSQYMKKWRNKNKDKVNQSAIKKREKEKLIPEKRMAKNLRRRVILALKGNPKYSTTFNLVGCDIKTLKNYLENLFHPGMTWDNYGEWHIDHIIPCASFNMSDPSQQQKCFHYTNMQPLWAIDNLKKGKKIS